MAWFLSTRPRGARPKLRYYALGEYTPFLSTRPRGARHSSRASAMFCLYVSIHAPAGGATSALVLDFELRVDVSIHAPAGGATVVQSNATDYVTVSIHAPAGGATLLVICSSILRRRFYPRARGGRDLTLRTGKYVPKRFLSTRPRGARLNVWHGGNYHARRFYPRARGGRDERKTKELQDCLVSIHAPAGGATKSLTVSLLPY